MDIDKIFKTEQSVIDTPNLKIKGNVLYFEDYFLQISNICQVSIAPIAKLKYSPWLLGIFLIGLILIFSPSILVGIVLVFFSGNQIYKIYKYNDERGEKIVIIMNSGTTFRFACRDRLFLNQVMEVLLECANNSQSNVIINLEDSIITCGEGNQVNANMK